MNCGWIAESLKRWGSLGIIFNSKNMTLLGNFFLVIAALISILIINLIYGHHNRGGDAGVGYAWSLMLALLVFVVCLSIVAISIGVKSGYAWVGSSGAMRTVWASSYRQGSCGKLSGSAGINIACTKASSPGR